jgi:hypothetical protein
MLINRTKLNLITSLFKFVIIRLIQTNSEQYVKIGLYFLPRLLQFTMHGHPATFNWNR